MNRLLSLTKKVEDAMERNKPFRYFVLVVVILNFIAIVVIPPLMYLLGVPEVAQFHLYVDLLWSALLAIIVVYYTSKADSTQRKYFDNHIPASLIAIYFVTLVIVFILKTIGFPIAYRIAVELASYDMETIRMQVWAPISYALAVWQFYTMHVVSRRKLLSHSQTT